MEKIKVNIEGCGGNFGASVDGWKIPGSVMATDKTLEGVKSGIADALRFHAEGMLADGDAVAGWLADGEYELEFFIRDGNTTLQDGLKKLETMLPHGLTPEAAELINKIKATYTEPSDREELEKFVSTHLERVEKDVLQLLRDASKLK